MGLGVGSGSKRTSSVKTGLVVFCRYLVRVRVRARSGLGIG